MNPRIAFPFLTLNDGSVDASPWEISLNGEDWQPAGDYLADWDCSSNITARRTLKIDRNGAQAALGMNDADFSLCVVCKAGTGQGRLPRLLARQLLVGSALATGEVLVELTLRGSELSYVLDLSTDIVLEVAPSSAGELSPKRAGDRVWQDRHRIRLEGMEPRFPIEIVDLADLLPGKIAAAAPWYLDWSAADWSRDFHGAIRLFLNSGCPDIIARIEAQDAYTLQQLLAEVMAQVCERMVADQDAQSIISGAETGSLAAQAAVWLSRAWPGRDPSFVRSVFEQRPGEFRATFLALAEIGDS